MTDNPFLDELQNLGDKNLLRKPVTFEKSDGRTVTLNGKDYLLFCSNDYLGLSHHPEVIEAVRKGARRYGYGSGASRLVSGATSPHAELEEKLAEYLKAESVLTFSSGYAANVGTIPALAGKGDVIVADRLNHASLVDGCLLSRAEFKRYPHLDMGALEKLLVEYKNARRRWIITDGLFSMDGDLAPLPEICELAKRYDARVYLDDAHAFGVMGENGRGTPEHFGVEGVVDVHMGTLGKAAGGMGAFAAGSKTIIDYLVNKARTFIFSTSMPPANALGSAKAVDILADFRKERMHFQNVVIAFHKELNNLNIAIKSQSYIMPVISGTAEKALGWKEFLLEGGIFVQAIRPPTVPEGTSRLRITLSLSQTPEDRQKLLTLLKTIGEWDNR